MSKPFFITTAIDYTNGAPHIGHAYEKVLADVLARYHRLKGDEVFYLTGVDQHGQKVQQSAEKQGVAPQQFVDELTAKFIALWAKLDVRYDRWAATTDPLHKDCVGQILTRLRDEGQLYKAKQGGYYSVRQEQFLTDKERNAEGEFGPEWGEVEFREEENYYFKLAQHKDWLLQLIKDRSAAGTPLVLPEFRVAELLNAVEKLSGDLCVSRPKARLAWGIEFPFDPEFVTYVWFDALVNYISFAPGFAEYFTAEAQRRREEEPSANLCTSAPLRFKELWPPLHVIGKDILIPAHGVYWPIMLKALGFADADIPTLLVHGWWNIAGAKMSKSLGNIVDPDALADKYGPEALRYYLMSDIATGKDADFDESRLVIRYNSDLANSLGNLLNRTLSMAAKYRNGRIALHDDPSLDSWEAVNLKFIRVQSADGFANYRGYFERSAPDVSLNEAFQRSRECNTLIEQAAPWKLAKMPNLERHLDAVLYHLAESLRIISILLSPVLPKAAQSIFDQLNWKMAEQGQETRFKLDDAKWGGLPDGHVLGQPTPLFPRIESSTA